MKKLLSVLLIAAMAISFTACGSNDVSVAGGEAPETITISAFDAN